MRGAVRAAVSLLTLSFFAPIATGCVSNEYLIPRDELHRLVMTPPEVRGQQVHVIQDLGSRRADAVPTDGPDWTQNAQPAPQPQPLQQSMDAPPPYQDDAYGGNVDVNIQGDIEIDGHVQPAAAIRGGPTVQGFRGTPYPNGRATASAGSWHGTPSPSGGTVTGGWHGSPPRGGGSGWHGTPSGGGSSGGGSSGGGGNFNISGGGGNGGEAMVLLAVVLAAVAVVMAISLVSSEGVRFDGIAQMSPWQPVHLKQHGGGELVIALGDLTPVAIDGAVEAKVMDDEGYGIRTLDHLRLDRRWAPVFKLDGGSMTFTRGEEVHSGIVADMQFGLFVRPWLGLLLTAGVGGAGDQYGATLTRHTFGFELQSLPLAAGPFQFGGYVNVGAAAVASTAQGSGPAEWGNAIGGGLLGEVQVSSRLAFTLRAGANEAFFANSGTTSPAATFAAGIALY
jgi:hypothetical protein